MASRFDRRQELGLTPVWRVRVARPSSPAITRGAPALDADRVSAAAEPAYAAAIAPLAVQLSAPGDSPAERLDEDRAYAAAVVDAPANLAPPVREPAPTLDRQGSANIVQDAHIDRGDDAGPARSARIATLDWANFANDVAACTACALSRTRKLTVPGVGDAQAEWMFVGEAPGAEEDAKGEPFVGQAGRLLDNMLAALGLRRDNMVYIANVLKCRPPNNRAPEPGEVESCRPYLDRQIALIRPKVIVALGKSAATTLLGTEATIASLRGRIHRYQDVPLIVTYHPAYLLRSLPDKAKAWEDLCLARATLRNLEYAQAAPN